MGYFDGSARFIVKTTKCRQVYTHVSLNLGHVLLNYGPVLLNLVHVLLNIEVYTAV